MIIKSIEITNFQSYYGFQRINFSEGLNLIVGMGGKGKSKLFNAFYWVLFGKIYITDFGWCTTNQLPDSSKNLMKRHAFINAKALFDASVTESVEALVTLEIEDDKADVYTITRSVKAVRQDANDWNATNAWVVENNMLKVWYMDYTGSRVSEDYEAEQIIKKLFPDDIRNYIWFQGEALKNLIDFTNKRTLEAVVKHISYFPFYEKMTDIIKLSVKRIENIVNRETRRVNQNNAALVNLLNEIEEKKRCIERAIADKKEIEDRINVIQIKLAADEKKLHGLASYSSLVKKYDDCQAEIMQYNNEMHNLDEYQRKNLRLTWVLRGISPLIQKSRMIINQYKEEEYTVPEKKYLDNPGRAKLEEIKKDKKCFVCGSPVIEGNAAYDYINERLILQEQYLQEMEDYTSNMALSKKFTMFVGKISDYPDVETSLSNIDQHYSKSEDEILKLKMKRKRKLDEKNRYDQEIDSIKASHGINVVTQAQTANLIGSSVKASKGELEKQQKYLQTYDEKISRFKRELKQKEKEYEALPGRDTTITRVAEQEWLDISCFLNDLCMPVQEKARMELLRKIEEKANFYYKKFTEHDDGYTGDIRISDDYSIAYDPGLNTSHDVRKKMSIINALLSLNQEAMGVYYPFISDAPSSSFDIPTTHKYLLGVKDIFKQTIIMTKDVEIGSDNYKDLYRQQNVNSIFELRSECVEQMDTLGTHQVYTIIKKLK